MKKLVSIIALILIVLSLNGQAPGSLKYQAVLQEADGTPKVNTAVTVVFDILQGSSTGTVVYSESHNVTTTKTGLISLDLGSGTPTSGTTLSAINWGTGIYFLKVTVNGNVMGTSQLLSVPYSLYSSKAGNGFSGNYNDLTNKPDLTAVSAKKVAVKGETSDMEEALFEVKNKNGQTVFAVYNEGVRIYVEDGTAKGTKGGFAIGGFGSKGVSQDYLVVNPDLIRMYVNETPAKGAKGGFAIGSFSPAKGVSQDLLLVNNDSIRAFIDSGTGKGSKGGFAIGGFSQGKGAEEEYLRVTRDSTRVYINSQGAKGAKGGFAIGSFNNSKGASSDYMLISPDSTNFYVRSLAGSGSSTFNILGIGQDQQQKSLMKANTDTIDMNSVLNLQNNMNVYGNIGYSGAVSQIVVPTLTTTEPTNVAQTTVTSGGNIGSNGGAAVIASGVVWGTSPNPTIALTTKTTDGSPAGSFTSSITGLTANTTYYVRAYATNSVGTGYGNSFGFTTTSGGATVTDMDGNIYNIITIGTQTWMAQNLKTGKLNDGSLIPNAIDPYVWQALSTPGYAWYDNDAATYQGTGYGALYNWFSVSSGKLCPAGWHVPTDGEWATLSTFLGGDLVVGGKLKETGMVHWQSPNTGATDEVGFTALPGGLRNYMGMFVGMTDSGSWWSSTMLDTQNSFFSAMNFASAEMMKQLGPQLNGLSVRCLQGLMPLLAPTVMTSPVDTYAYTTATGGGNVMNDGGAAVTERGICWSTTPLPTTADSKTSDATGTGVFVSNMTGLTPGTIYYVRAYAKNSVGTSYGNEVTFMTWNY